MVKLQEVFMIVAYTEAGIAIKKQPTKAYPEAHELEQFANGYQQADYIKVEKEYRYLRED